MRIGLALSGGGARGLAHIPMLEVLDELGIRPCCIAGTSIGAVIGAIYASGVHGSTIREHTRRILIGEGDSLREILSKKDALAWIKMLDVDFLGNALFKGDAFVEFLYERIEKTTFEELSIPLKVVATDFWNSSQVVFDKGDLFQAIKASMGLPGVFSPVILEGRTLIDGGGVNPMPHDLLTDCDIVIAVNVMGRIERKEGHRSPTAVRAVLETYDIMQRTIIAEKMARVPPDIYIAPELLNVDILEFHKYEEIFTRSEPSKRLLRRKLLELRRSDRGGAAPMDAPELEHPWQRLGLSREGWTALARAFFAAAHGSRREFDETPAAIRESAVGALCAAYLETRDHALLDQAGTALTGTREWYTYLGRMF